MVLNSIISSGEGIEIILPKSFVFLFLSKASFSSSVEARIKSTCSPWQKSRNIPFREKVSHSFFSGNLNPFSLAFLRKVFNFSSLMAIIKSASLVIRASPKRLAASPPIRR